MNFSYLVLEKYDNPYIGTEFKLVPFSDFQIEPKGKHLAGDENDSEIRNKFESEFQKTLKIGVLKKNYPEEKNKSLKVADEI